MLRYLRKFLRGEISASQTANFVDISTNTALNEMVHEHQKSVGPVLADYPNYISPDADGEQVWGNNVQRLIDIKEKYDPECLLAAGRVFASPGCINRGKANIFAGECQVR